MSRFNGNQLSEVRLYAVEDGNAELLLKSVIPRLVTDRAAAAKIFKEITGATRQFDLPPLVLKKLAEGVVTIQAGL